MLSLVHRTLFASLARADDFESLFMIVIVNGRWLPVINWLTYPYNSGAPVTGRIVWQTSGG
jgi:hypothetical protein